MLVGNVIEQTNAYIKLGELKLTKYVISKIKRCTLQTCSKKNCKVYCHQQDWRIINRMISLTFQTINNYNNKSKGH